MGAGISMEQLLSTNRYNNGAANNICHCLLMQVSLYMINAAILLCYRILCMVVWVCFHCDFMDICSGYYVGIFCISWTAILSDVCVSASCAGNRNGPNI